MVRRKMARALPKAPVEDVLKKVIELCGSLHDIGALAIPSAASSPTRRRRERSCSWSRAFEVFSLALAQADRLRKIKETGAITTIIQLLGETDSAEWDAAAQHWRKLSPLKH
jgi:hypothetical protein